MNKEQFEKLLNIRKSLNKLRDPALKAVLSDIADLLENGLTSRSSETPRTRMYADIKKDLSDFEANLMIQLLEGVPDSEIFRQYPYFLAMIRSHQQTTLGKDIHEEDRTDNTD